MPLMRLLTIVCITWSPICARAQEVAPPDPSRAIGQAVEKQLRLEVESRLRSKNLKTVAWGAWLAAKHRVRSAIPAVRASLAALEKADPKERKFAVQSLLDALLSNRARVTATELTAFCKGIHEPAALALLAADPKANRERFFKWFLQHDKKGRESRWLASGNLLAGIKDREFARYLVKSLTYRLEITVHDKGSNLSMGVGGAFGGKFADGRFTVPPGYPPMVTYHLQVRPKPGDVLFALGKKPVYWRRVVHQRPRVGVGGMELIALRGRPKIRVHWIGTMLDQSWLTLPEVTRKWISWSNAEKFKEGVAQHRQPIAAAHDRMVQRAFDKGWFTEKERPDLAARITIRVKDQRKDQSIALPTLH